MADEGEEPVGEVIRVAGAGPFVVDCGDVILLAYGGHGFEMLEPTEMIEVKQGPYAGDNDKTRFEGISADQAVIKP
jgi:hypothetical protein